MDYRTSNQTSTPEWDRYCSASYLIANQYTGTFYIKVGSFLSQVKVNTKVSTQATNQSQWQIPCLTICLTLTSDRKDWPYIGPGHDLKLPSPSDFSTASGCQWLVAVEQQLTPSESTHTH